MARKRLNELREGDNFNGLVVAVHEHAIGEARNGTSYRKMVVGDCTGKLRAIQWQAVANGIQAGDAVQVAGHVESYQGDLQLKVSTIRTVESDPYIQDLIETASIEEIGQAFAKAQKLIDAIGNATIQAVVRKILIEDDYLEKMANSPASGRYHHCKVGELLTHTIEIAEIVEDIGRHFDLDLDLLVAGALLHDVGKVLCYDHRGLTRKFTAEAGLLDHVFIGAHLVLRAAEMLRQKIDDYDREKVLRLAHMILAHHGTKEWGAPVIPKFTEAEVLHFIDMISSRVDTYRQIAEKSDKNEVWSEYDRLLKRSIYMPAMNGLG